VWIRDRTHVFVLLVLCLQGVDAKGECCLCWLWVWSRYFLFWEGCDNHVDGNPACKWKLVFLVLVLWFEKGEIDLWNKSIDQQIRIGI